MENHDGHDDDSNRLLLAQIGSSGLRPTFRYATATTGCRQATLLRSGVINANQYDSAAAAEFGINFYLSASVWG